MKAQLYTNCRLADGSIVDILVRDGIIFEVGNEIPPMNAHVFDCDRNLVVPGLVDCHMHLDKTLIAHETPNSSGTLGEAITITQRRKRDFTKDEIMTRARTTIEMAISSGTTFIRTNVDVDPIVGLTGVMALLELKNEYKGRLQLQIVAFPQEGIVNSPGTLGLLEEALVLGAEVIGGIPARDINPDEHIKTIFDLAEKYDVPLDIHTDESDNPSDLTILTIAEQTIARGLEGKVSVAHCCSLGALAPTHLNEVLNLIYPAELNIVVVPSTNLYLQGRNDSFRVRRGIAPVKNLLAKEFPVAFASDNVQDAFNPFGNANLLEIALIGAHGCHMGGRNELEQVFKMISSVPRVMVGLNGEIQTGRPADFVLFPAQSGGEAIIRQTPILERVYGGLPDGFLFRA